MPNTKKPLTEGRGEEPSTPRPSIEVIKSMRGEKPASPRPQSPQPTQAQTKK